MNFIYYAQIYYPRQKIVHFDSTFVRANRSTCPIEIIKTRSLRLFLRFGLDFSNIVFSPLFVRIELCNCIAKHNKYCIMHLGFTTLHKKNRVFCHFVSASVFSHVFQTKIS